MRKCECGVDALVRRAQWALFSREARDNNLPMGMEGGGGP